MNTENLPATRSNNYSLPDRWIRSRLGATISEVSDHIQHYRLDLAAKALYEFTWNEYCDWYLELTKPILQGEDVPAAEQLATRGTLIGVLETLLRCLHPIIPFITEEIWQRVAPVAGVSGATIMLQPFPTAADHPRDEVAEKQLQWVMGFVLGVRQIRGEMDISPAKSLTVLVQGLSKDDQASLDTHRLYLCRLARLDAITVLGDSEEPPPSATALHGAMKLLVPMAGLIDVDAERERLQKKRGKADDELQKLSAKLANENFVARAPANVVAKERERQAELQLTLTQLDDQLHKLTKL